MKLYDVPRNTWVRIIADNKNPPAAKETAEGDVVKLHTIDGMYSYCTNKQGQVVHLVAWAEVEIVDELLTP